MRPKLTAGVGAPKQRTCAKCIVGQHSYPLAPAKCGRPQRERMEPPAAPRTPDQHNDAAADLAVRVRRLELEPAAPSSAPSTPVDERRRGNSQRPVWPTTPVTPPVPAGNQAAGGIVSASGALPSGSVSTGGALKRLRSFGGDAKHSGALGYSAAGCPIGAAGTSGVASDVSDMQLGAADTDCRQQPATADTAMNGVCQTSGMRQYLCYFVHRLLDYRTPEIEALAAMSGVALDLIPPVVEPDVSPFYYCRLPSDEVARQIAERSILLKVRARSKACAVLRKQTKEVSRQEQCLALSLVP